MAERLVIVPLLAQDAPYAREAAKRFSADRQDRSAMVDGDSVIISGRGGADILRRVWRITILNERLIQETDDARRHLLAGLLS